MKKYLLLLITLFCCDIVVAQPRFFAGHVERKVTQKQIVPQIYGSDQIDQRYIEASCKEILSRYGKLIESKRTYSLQMAIIPAISNEPIDIDCRYDMSRGTTTLAMSVKLSNGDMVSGIQNPDDPKFKAAGNIVNQIFDNAHRIAEIEQSARALDDAEREYNKVMGIHERLLKDRDRNRQTYLDLKQRLTRLDEEFASINRDIAAFEGHKKTALDKRTKMQSVATDAWKKKQTIH
jgi:hypothetical protein